MFRNLAIGLICSLFILFAAANASVTYQTLTLEIRFIESAPHTQLRPETVICDTILLLKGKEIDAFSGNLSLTLKFLDRTDSAAEIELSQISLAPRADSKSQKLKSSLGAPYITDSVLIKGDHVYKVLYTPLAFGELTSECEYDHNAPDQFNSDPSSNFDIYFVPNSLADFHWNRIRDFLEHELDQFQKVFNFTQPGKINCFLYPCPSYVMAKFKNSDFGIHPAKNTLFQEYNQQSTSLPVIGSNLLKLYRYWGYSPKLLVEGAANFIDFYNFYCLDYKIKGGLYPLRKMLISRDYDNLPDVHKKRMQAASFVTYLIKQFNLQNFRELYSQATDLTLEDCLAKHTGRSFSQLEKEWLNYLDTMKVEVGWYNYYAQREMNQRNLEQGIYLFETALKKQPNDSNVLSQLYNAYYLVGDYSHAVNAIRSFQRYYPNNRNYLTLANMSMAEGRLDSAGYYYKKVREVDSSADLVPFKLGQIEFHNGNYSAAKQYFQTLIAAGKSIPFKTDGQLYLGQIARLEHQSDSANSLFLNALNSTKQLLSSSGDNPIYNLRAGEAALNLNEIKSAREYLNLAEFVEERPFYLGRVLLALGKTYDLENDRETARKYYQRVLDIHSAFLDKSEAQKLLDKPFKL